MNPKNPYEFRWRWWYEGIADLMIAHPDWKQSQIAAELGKAECTISLIVNTDLFREHFAKRRGEWRERHDFGIVEKSTRVAQLGLDILLETMEKKRGTVPLDTIDRITTSALDRLGYGAQSAPLVQVNNVDASRSVAVQVTASGLSEARMLIRQVEDMRRNGYALPAPADVSTLDAMKEPRREPETQEEVEANAPALPFL